MSVTLQLTKYLTKSSVSRFKADSCQKSHFVEAMHNPNQVLSAWDPIRVKSFGVTAAATTLTMWITTGCNMALSYYMQKRKWTMQRLNGSGCIEISLAPKSSRCSHSYCQHECGRLVDRVSPWKDPTINRHFVQLHFVTSLPIFTYLF